MSIILFNKSNMTGGSTPRKITGIALVVPGGTVVSQG